MAAIWSVFKWLGCLVWKLYFKTGTFDSQTDLENLNTGHVWYSYPHCVGQKSPGFRCLGILNVLYPGVDFFLEWFFSMQLIKELLKHLKTTFTFSQSCSNILSLRHCSNFAFFTCQSWSSCCWPEWTWKVIKLSRVEICVASFIPPENGAPLVQKCDISLKHGHFMNKLC